MASLGIEIVGILNLSPDSFSDGHICETLSVSERLRILVEDGADRIDVGGESTAPGSSPIDERTELSRLQPFFQEARTCSIPFSVDTMKSRVALAGIEAGSDMINDVSGGRSDPRMLDLLSEHPSVRYVLMYSAHSGGRPDKKKPSRSEDILADVSRFFETRLHACALVGMRQEQIILDPGIGAFVSPDPEDSLRILRNIRTLKERFDQPIYV
ncbi:MAG TPA: dihydropteroate synthase [bacterium]|nr:dihydropteroate synthase [bacterium]